MKEIYQSKKYVVKDFIDTYGRNIRALCTQNATQSMCFKDKKMLFEIPEKYITLYSLMFLGHSNIKNILMLGGGGMTFPKYVISHYPFTNVKAIESDVEVIDLAKKYFYLEDLFNSFDKKHERLQIVKGNAIQYVKFNKEKYDSVLIDIFKDSTPIKEIYSDDFLKALKCSLTFGGIILNNYIYKKENKKEFKRQIENIKKYFGYLKIVSIKTSFDYLEQKGNILLIYSDDEICIKPIYDDLIELQMDELV